MCLTEKNIKKETTVVVYMPTRDTVVCRDFPVLYKQRGILFWFLDNLPPSLILHIPIADSPFVPQLLAPWAFSVTQQIHLYSVSQSGFC